MRVGTTGSRPSPAVSPSAWFAMLQHHADEFDRWWGIGERRRARDALCCLVHTELAFLGFMRSGEQVSLQREDVATVLCGPEGRCCAAPQKLAREAVSKPQYSNWACKASARPARWRCKTFLAEAPNH
jgi:hypothetical protein